MPAGNLLGTSGDFVGPKLASLGAGIAYHATLREDSRPVAVALWNDTKETVNLGVLEGHEVLYLEVIESPHSFRMASQLGMHGTLNCTALGKALLAFLRAKHDEELLAVLAFERSTPRTIPNLARLRKELVRVVQRGLRHRRSRDRHGRALRGRQDLGREGKGCRSH